MLVKKTISIDKETMILLQEWKIRQQFEFNVLGFKTANKHQLVFPNKKNKFCRPGQANDWHDMIGTKYFYPEREERSADQFAQFIEKEKYLF